MSVAFANPPPQQGIDIVRQLQETVETQARTIRYLLSNYEALLRKVQGESGDTLKWSAGAAKNFAANDKVDAGWWVKTSSAGNLNLPDFAGGHRSVTPDQWDAIFVGDDASAASAITLVPLHAEVVPKED